MELLKKKILQDGRCYPGGILKVDGFINHQIDPGLMKAIGIEFIRRFASTSINKIMTIEASGIAPAVILASLMDLPVVFVKKKIPNTLQHFISTTVHSFTKDRDYEVVVGLDYVGPNDKILFIDDFLAYGNAALGVAELVDKAGAEITGMGFIIEKEFQHGRRRIESKGIKVESLAVIESLYNKEIKIKNYP